MRELDELQELQKIALEEAKELGITPARMVAAFIQQTMANSKTDDPFGGSIQACMMVAKFAPEIFGQMVKDWSNDLNEERAEAAENFVDICREEYRFWHEKFGNDEFEIREVK